MQLASVRAGRRGSRPRRSARGVVRDEQQGSRDGARDGRKSAAWTQATTRQAFALGVPGRAAEPTRHDPGHRPITLTRSLPRSLLIQAQPRDPKPSTRPPARIYIEGRTLVTSSAVVVPGALCVLVELAPGFLWSSALNAAPTSSVHFVFLMAPSHPRPRLARLLACLRCLRRPGLSYAIICLS